MRRNTRSTRQQGVRAEEIMSDDASGPEDAAAESRAFGAPAPAPANTASSGASTSVDTERLFTGAMEAFARMQAETTKTLIESLRSLTATPRPSASPTAPAFTAPGGNFAKCTARFDGRSRDAEVLEAFIDAVEIYKECANVSDEHALRGLPVLLEGDAAVWWRGARASAATWTDAVARLRAMYGMQQPAYKVLRDIFTTEQKETERGDVFVCKVRSLLVRLPYEVPVKMQIDVIYGLLHRRIRKRLSRDVIDDNVNSLLEKVRVMEDSIAEIENSPQPCNSRESRDVSRARESNERGGGTTMSANATTGAELTSNSNENPKRNNRVRCSFCKYFGHVAADCRNLNNNNKSNDTTKSNRPNANKTGSNPIRCYGCGQPGVVRSRCGTCLDKKLSTTKSSEFNIVTDDSSRLMTSSHPTVSVVIANREGVAIFDTGATSSIASPKLYSILRSKGVYFREVERTIGLADGSHQPKVVLTATVPVVLEGRQVPVEFVVFPGENTRTLLGRDFIARARIVLDIAQESWFFSDRPYQIFPFVKTYSLNSTELMRADIVGPRVSCEKSQFAVDSVEFLGHVILPGSMHVDPDKMSAIADKPSPHNAKQLKYFLQTSSWCRRFVPNYAEISQPLTSLLKKASTWKWGPEQQSAFETIKSILVSASILRQADETKPFVLRTDSTGYALGAALLQGEGTDEQPVEYASRLLTTAERNYSTTEREVLAVVWAVSKFRGYIDGTEVVLKSDRQPLSWLMSLKSPSGRLARWALCLQKYLKIGNSPGKSNVPGKAQVVQRRYADEHRRPMPEYQKGDLVLLKTRGVNDTNKGQTPKFIPRRDGPYRIREVVGSTTYALERISDGISLGKYHVSLLTPFVGHIQAPIQEKRRRGRPRKANPTSGAFVRVRGGGCSARAEPPSRPSGGVGNARPSSVAEASPSAREGER